MTSSLTIVLSWHRCLFYRSLTSFQSFFTPRYSLQSSKRYLTITYNQRSAACTNNFVFFNINVIFLDTDNIIKCHSNSCNNSFTGKFLFLCAIHSKSVLFIIRYESSTKCPLLAWNRLNSHHDFLSILVLRNITSPSIYIVMSSIDTICDCSKHFPFGPLTLLFLDVFF